MLESASVLVNDKTRVNRHVSMSYVGMTFDDPLVRLRGIFDQNDILSFLGIWRHV